MEFLCTRYQACVSVGSCLGLSNIKWPPLKIPIAYRPLFFKKKGSSLSLYLFSDFENLQKTKTEKTKNVTRKKKQKERPTTKCFTRKAKAKPSAQSAEAAFPWRFTQRDLGAFRAAGKHQLHLPRRPPCSFVMFWLVWVLFWE